jgi:hypothetical protein
MGKLRQQVLELLVVVCYTSARHGQSTWRCLGGYLEASRENLLALIANDYRRPALPKEIKTRHLDQVN